jgi:hypothetical protein
MTGACNANFGIVNTNSLYINTVLIGRKNMTGHNTFRMTMTMSVKVPSQYYNNDCIKMTRTINNTLRI